MTFPLSYLFYAGIIVPTVVTLALFVFFVICWRKQSARKAVLTKPYDPHGTMRKLGIPNRPPPPPVFLQGAGGGTPRGVGGVQAAQLLDLGGMGGEDNAAYDMSRSPSAEANSGAGGAGGRLGGAGPPPSSSDLGGLMLGPGGGLGVSGYRPPPPPPHPLPPQHLHLRNLSSTLSADTYCSSHQSVVGGGGRVVEFRTSPSGELDLMGRLAFHNRLDSGLSEPAAHCDSPSACSHHGDKDDGGGGGGGAVGGLGVGAGDSVILGGGGGAGSGVGVGGQGGSGGGSGSGSGPGSGGHQQQQQQRDRPHSQNSHSSHSTDSEDSGFRSSRSGQFSGGGGCQHHEPPPVMKRSRSGGCGKARRSGGKSGRGLYQKAATSSPESETEPSIQLTPTALWTHHHHHYPHHHPVPTHCSSNPHSPLHGGGGGGAEGEGAVKNTGVDLADISPQLGWKYLQELASPGRGSGVGGQGSGSGSGSHGGTQQQGPQRQTLTCHQSMTMAQVHTANDLDNPDVFGFSVV